MPITQVDDLVRQRRQFRSVFHTVVEFEAKYDPASVGSNSTVADEISVPGVELGDMVMISLDVDVQDLTITANVTAAGTITVTAANTTAGAVDLPESNLHVIVLRPTHSHTS